MKRLKNEPLLLLVIIAIILFVGIFVIYPVVKVILFPDGGTYLELFNRPRWLTAIKNSLFMTLVSTISCTAVAFLFAYVIARLDVPCKGLFRFITLLPIVSPPFIVALSYILLFGVQGIITKGLLGLHVDIYGRLGLWIVQTVTFFPYAYSVIYGVMKGISTNLEYAAYNMGATRWQVFRDVFWPHGGVYADQRLVRHEYSFRPGGGTADPGRGAVPGEPLLGGQAVLCYHYRQGDFAKSLSGPQVGEVDPVHADHADLPVRPSGVRHPFLRGLHQDLGI